MRARPQRGLRPWWLLVLLVVGILVAACADGTGTGGTGGTGAEQEPTTEQAEDPAADEAALPSGTIRLYSSVTQDTIDAVLAEFAQAYPDVDVELFRAPTGELNARLAAEQREGEVQADVLWLTDPLSMQEYDAQGLLATWQPEEAPQVPEDFRTARFWGTRVLNMVIVHQQDLQDPPVSWDDLAVAAYPEPVAIPDPSFAGSAFGALGYLALDPSYGMSWYEQLRANGGVQVQAPDEVTTGVAQGRFAAGMTLDNSARQAVEAGSPLVLVWPEPGAIAMYSPIAVIEGTEDAQAAQAFANFTLTVPAQEAIAGTGWQPVRADVEWSDEGPTVTPDWTAAFDRQDDLLAEYRAVFEG